MPAKPNILFVDDEVRVLDALRRALRSQCAVWQMHFAQSVDEALEKTEATSFDAIVTDVTMPGRDGLDLLITLQGADTTHDIPVLILTGLGDVDLKRRALALGAVDLLNKPIIAEDVIARLRHVLRLKSYHDELKGYAETLEQRVHERTLAMERSRLEIVWRLAKAGEYRDEQTGNHVVRVGSYSRVLAETLGMSSDFIETIFLTSPLHDIGKIGIPDAILLKNGPLSAAEWAIMRRHCEYGHELLRQEPAGLASLLGWRRDDSPTGQPSLENPLLRQAAVIALAHHERWDGSGYPNGLRGTEIPIEARIVAIADVYDALSHTRTYKPAYPEDKVLSIMTTDSAGHFDPDVFSAFRCVVEEFRAISLEFADVPRARGVAA